MMTDTQANSAPRKTAKIMISYSRKDGDFVRKLYNGLIGYGFSSEDIWVDWEGIEISEDWMAKITKGIREANAFIFVISPDSIASPVCQEEIKLADESNKRFIPILYREVGKVELHKKLSSHNWAKIQDENQLEQQLPALVKAINTDLDWLERHTQLFNKAKEWESKGRKDSNLVRDNDLTDAVNFITDGATGKEPAPSPLHIEYVKAARKYAAAVRRRNRIISIVVGVILFVATIFSLVQWGNAVDARNEAVAARDFAVTKQAEADAAKIEAQEKEAEARKKERLANAYGLAAESINQRDIDSQLSLMLALLSIQETEVDKLVLPESKYALFSSLSTPNVLHTWKTDNAIVWDTAYDPNGTFIAIGDDSGLVQVVNAVSGQQVFTIRFDSSITALDFSPDGTRLGIASGTTNDNGDPIGLAKIWDVAANKELLELAGHDTYQINDIDFSPDGNWIATAGDDYLVKIWDAKTGVLREPSLSGHNDKVVSVEFNRDGTQLVSGSWDDTAIIWNVATSSPAFTLPMDDYSEETDEDVESVAFSPDGSRVITGGYKTVIVWNALDGTEIRRLYGNHADIYDVDFTPDNSSLLTASSGIKLWDNNTGTERYNLSAHHGEVNSVALNKTGDRMVTGSWDFTAKLWAVNLKIENRRFDQSTTPKIEAIYSPDGKWIAITDWSWNVSIYDAQSAQPVDELSGTHVSFRPGNNQQVLTDDGTTISLWTIGKDEPSLSFSDEENGIRSTIFTPDGKQILFIDGNLALKVWDIENGGGPSVVEGFSESRLFDTYFNEAGNFLLAQSGNNAVIWNLKAADGAPVTLAGHTDLVLTGVFSPDGRYVYTGGFDNIIRKWDAKTGKPLLVMTGHTGRVLDLDVNQDGTLITSASADTTVRVWDTEKGKEVYKYDGNIDESRSVAFSLDGTKVLTASMDGVTKEFIVDFNTLKDIALSSYELEPLTNEECQRYVKRDNCALNLVASAPVAGGSGTPTTPTLRSGDGTTPVTLVIENNTELDVDVFWIDFDGLERPYFNLAPGDVVEQGTYSTHIWRVRDLDGSIVMDYTVAEEPRQTMEITGDANSGTGQTGPVAATEASAVSAAGSFYTEEFDQESVGWKRFMTTGTENQVETSFDSGSLFVTLSPDEDKIPRFYLLNNNSDYSSVQLDLTTTNHGNNANGVSLICNYNDVNWYEFMVSNSGLYEIYAYDPTAADSRGYIMLANGGSAAIKSGQGATNTYRAVCNGSELSLFINEKLEITFDDTQYNLNGGRIGIGASSPNMLPVDISFDVLTVSEP